MKRKYVLLMIIVVLAIAGGIAFSRVHDQPTEEQVQSAKNTTALNDDKTGLRVDQPTSLESIQPTQEDSSRGQLWKLQQPEGSTDQFQISAYYEQGPSLTKLAGATKKPLREAVVDNINLQLPKQHKGYKQLTQRNLSVNGIDANETIFEYANAGVVIRQRLLLLIKNSDTALYIRGQAKASDYERIDAQYFDPVFQSPKFE